MCMCVHVCDNTQSTCIIEVIELIAYPIESMVEHDHDDLSSALKSLPHKDISRMWVTVDEPSEEDHLTVHPTQLQRIWNQRSSNGRIINV